MDYVEPIGESDWEDQDLLTHDEAGERMRLGIAASSQLLAELRATGTDPKALAVEEGRVDLMKERLREIDEALARNGGVNQR